MDDYHQTLQVVGLPRCPGCKGREFRRLTRKILETKPDIVLLDYCRCTNCETHFYVLNDSAITERTDSPHPKEVQRLATEVRSKWGRADYERRYTFVNSAGELLPQRIKTAPGWKPAPSDD